MVDLYEMYDEVNAELRTLARGEEKVNIGSGEDFSLEHEEELV